MIDKKVLHLTLKKKWFDMILSGEKKEEYREYKPYWIERLMHFDYVERNNVKSAKSFNEFKHFDAIHFTNGYGGKRPSFIIECRGLQIGQGMRSWGAGEDDVFVISLGNIISKTNC